MTPREFEEGLREFIRIQKLIQQKIISFMPAGADKLTNEKVKADASSKQKEAFMKWTNELNKKAAFKDYLAIQTAQQEESEEPQN